MPRRGIMIRTVMTVAHMLLRALAVRQQPKMGTTILATSVCKLLGLPEETGESAISCLQVANSRSNMILLKPDRRNLQIRGIPFFAAQRSAGLVTDSELDSGAHPASGGQ